MKTPRHASRAAVRRLCICALLAAMSVTLAYIAKMIFGTGPLRITFENLPIVYAGVSFGPLAGVLVGIVADLTSCLFAGQAPVPLITVGTVLIGLISGVLGYTLRRRLTRARLILCELCAQLTGSVLVKSAALYIYFSYSPLLLWPRLPIYVGIALVEGYILFLLFKNPSIRRLTAPSKEIRL